MQAEDLNVRLGKFRREGISGAPRNAVIAAHGISVSDDEDSSHLGKKHLCHSEEGNSPPRNLMNATAFPPVNGRHSVTALLRSPIHGILISADVRSLSPASLPLRMTS